MEDSYCLGNGIAKACAEKSGPRLKLSDHMIQHWDRIGFQPSEFKIEDDLDNIIDVEIRESSSFSPATKQIAPDNEEQSCFTGVVVNKLGQSQALYIKYHPTTPPPHNSNTSFALWPDITLLYYF